jgi:hypothetical protein
MSFTIIRLCSSAILPKLGTLNPNVHYNPKSHVAFEIYSNENITILANASHATHVRTGCMILVNSFADFKLLPLDIYRDAGVMLINDDDSLRLCCELTVPFKASRDYCIEQGMLIAILTCPITLYDTCRIVDTCRPSLAYYELCQIYLERRDYGFVKHFLNRVFELRPIDSYLLDRCIEIELDLIAHTINLERTNGFFFPVDFVTQRKEPRLTHDGQITVTITSCKRLRLFIRTVDSYLSNCLDVNNVKEIVCVDDNSSDQDRETMKKLFPFIRYVFKSEAEKGHVESMRIIQNMVRSGDISTKYIFHLEDDWLFLDTFKLSDMIEILEDDACIKQVAINRNYVICPQLVVVGGIERYTAKNLRYFLHQHCTTPEQIAEFNITFIPNLTTCYWPHFTLQPSLIDASVFRDESVEFRNVSNFEKDFAHQYADKGWKTAFVQQRHIINHIGNTIKALLYSRYTPRIAYERLSTDYNDGPCSTLDSVRNDFKNTE